MQLAAIIDALLSHQLGSPWVYTLSRSVLLLVGLLTLRAVRHYPWLWAGILISVAALTLRVAADVLGGHGASVPYTVYAFLSNVAPVVMYVGVARMATLLRRLACERQRALDLIHDHQHGFGEVPAPGGTL